MKIQLKDFRVPEGDDVDLKKWPTKVDPVFRSKAHYEDTFAAQVETLSALQKVHYASNKHALLLIFQAMDAAGKDSAIQHAMSGVNPQGCQVFSFKHPSAAELEHDFLSRTTRDLPERGRIGIFNRSLGVLHQLRRSGILRIGGRPQHGERLCHGFDRAH